MDNSKTLTEITGQVERVAGNQDLETTVRVSRSRVFPAPRPSSSPLNLLAPKKFRQSFGPGDLDCTRKISRTFACDARPWEPGQQLVFSLVEIALRQGNLSRQQGISRHSNISDLVKFCARDGWFPATAGELCAFAEDSADQIDEWLPRNGENGVYEVIGAAGSRVETVPKNEEGVSGPSLAVAALWFEHWVGNCAGWKSVAEPGKRLPEFGHWLLVRPA